MVSGHPREIYNGKYFRYGYWAGKPHYKNSEDAHLFRWTIPNEDVEDTWNFDNTDQSLEFTPGILDHYDGGFMYSTTNFDYQKDLNGTMFLEKYKVEIKLSLNIQEEEEEEEDNEAVEEEEGNPQHVITAVVIGMIIFLILLVICLVFTKQK